MATKEELQGKVLAELQQIAESMGMTGTKGLRKADLIGAIVSRLDAIDLNLIADELQSLADEIVNVVDGLDPRPVIAQLQGLTDEVKAALAAGEPREHLPDP